MEPAVDPPSPTPAPIASSTDGLSTTALITGLVELLSDWPEQGSDARSRLEVYRTAEQELGRRGIDSAAMIRYGLLPHVVLPIAFALAVKWGRVVPANVRDFAATLAVDTERWAEALSEAGHQVTGDASDRELATILQAVADDVTSWALDAPMLDLLSLTAPSAATLAAAKLTALPDRAVFHRYSWLIDRFSTADLSQWATESLLLEHRWIQGREAAPCPEGLMSERQVSMPLLASQIAHRTANAQDRGNPEWNLALRMQGRAEELLGEGRFAEAAALFDFAISQEPNNAIAQNNLGFCLLPTDPSRALRHLRMADQLGYELPAVNLHNQVLALSLGGTPRAALSLSEGRWAHLPEEPAAGIVWRRSGEGSLVLCTTQDVRRDLADVLAELTEQSGLKSTHDWRALAATGDGPPSLEP